MLIEKETFTSDLIAVLQEIFSRYKSNSATGLTQIEASRLWYQSGLRLSCLNEVLDNIIQTENKKKIVCFNDFHRLLQRIITDDEKHRPSDANKNESIDFRVGFSNGHVCANASHKIIANPFFIY